MTLRSIRPSAVSGTIVAPPSKSYTHRSLVAAFLADGPSEIVGPLESVDTSATRSAIAALGRPITEVGGCWAIPAANASASRSREIRVDCRRSGTTLRLLLAAAATRATRVVFEGDAQLAGRPILPLVEVLREAGAEIRLPDRGRSLPLAVRGPIHSVDAEIDCTASSQFLSALLFALPTLGGDSVLRVLGRLPSRPYVDATLDVLRRAGIHIRFDGRVARIPGGQRIRPGRMDVPGDASSAAYFWAAGALAGGPVDVRGIDPGRPQADLAILDILSAMGARVHRTRSGAVAEGSALVATRADLTDAPDLYPLVGVLGALADGESTIVGAPQVAYKESDRRRAAIGLVQSMGGRARAEDQSVGILGRRRPKSFRLTRSQDHRVVMSAAVGALAGRGRSVVGDADAVRKSYPGFWDALGSIGGRNEPVER